jgi:tetratricopeptide (TPR) repeat protein
MSGSFRLLTSVGALALRGVRLPVDLLFLSFDFLRYTVWAVGQIPLRLQGLLPDPYPPCVSPVTADLGSGRELPCAQVRKYGNPFLLRLLFPGITATRTPDGGTEWNGSADCINSPSTILRYLAAAGVLALFWTGAGLGALAWLAPGTLRGCLAGPVPDRAGVTVKPAGAAPAQTDAPRQAAADQLLAAKSWSEARQAYTDVLRADPANPDARVGKGQAALELGFIEEARACFDTVLAASPRHPGALLGSATVGARTGREAKAVDALTLLLAASPDHPRARALLAECLRRLGRLDEALTAAQTALQAAPDNRELILTAARVCAQKQDFAQATTLFAKAVELDPSDPVAYVERADLLRRQGQLGACEAELTALLSTFPDDPAVVAALVDAQVQQGNSTKALDLCKAVTGRHPDLYRLREVQATLLLDSGRRDEAYLAATALLRDQPGNRSAHLRLATLYLQCGLPSLAEEHCRKALAQGESTQDAHRLLARACMDKGDWPQCIVTIEALLHAAPDDLGLLVGLAKCQANTGNRTKAIQTLQQACAKQPQAALPVAELGTQQFQAGKPDEALATFRHAHELDPGDWFIQNNLAVLLSREGKDLDQALTLARLAFDQAPASPNVADTLGWVHVLRREYDLAAPFLAFAFGAAGDAPQILYHYAELKSHLGDRNAALQLVRKAVALDRDSPDLEPARLLLRELEKPAATTP